MSGETVLQLFVSSPGDVPRERDRIDAIVERLNGEYKGRVRIRTVRWETRFYSSHDTFQAQIPEAAECDLVLAIFGARLGSPLPEAFPPMPSGERYPSGTAYEILSAIDARRRGSGIPDIYVFRRPTAPLVALDAADRAEIEAQWHRLTAFFETWFRARSGEFLAAFQEFATTDEFAAKAEDCLRQWLARRGFPPEAVRWDRAAHGSPYPGLDAFDETRRAVFFGRGLALDQILRRLRDTEAADAVPFVLLIGASGSGKSSLLRAGVLPRIGRPGLVPEVDLWRRAVMVPGLDPFGSLADALLADEALGGELAAGPLGDRGLLAKQLAADPDLAVAPIRAALDRAARRRQQQNGFEAPRPARLFLAIDQAERILIETPPAVRERFADLVARLCRDRLATVFVVLRSDAYPQFQAVEAFVALRRDGATLDLLPPTPGELEEMATRPAAVSTPPLAFERRDGRSLAAVLVADARGGDALALMQMALARLAAAEAERGDGPLRFSDHHGLGEAVSRTAADALDQLDAAARAALPDLILGLVRDLAIDPETGRAVPAIGALDRARFEAGRPERRALVESFVAHRLLIAEGDDAVEHVRPTHESLLRIWPEAVAILDDGAALVRARAAIEPLARDWAEAPDAEKPRRLEIPPALLEAAEAAVARFGDEIAAPTRAFVAAAAAVATARRDAERREQQRRLADAEAIARAERRIARATAFGLAGALILAAIAGWQWWASTVARQEAQLQRDRAEHTLAAAVATADGLVFDLAQKLRNVAGVPKSVVRDILDQARRLQEQLIGSGETGAALTATHAAALGETAETDFALGDAAAALREATIARDAYAGLAAARPDDVRWVYDLAHSENLIAAALARLGRPAEAEAARLRGETGIETAIARGLDDPRLPQLLASILQDRGVAARDRGDLVDALALHRRGLGLLRGLVDRRPGDAVLRHDLAIALRAIGDIELESGAIEAADADFAAASEVAAALAREQPRNTVLQRDFTLTQERLGHALMKKADFAGALSAFRDGEATALALAASDPSNLDWQFDVAIGHREIGDARQALGDLAGAAEEFRSALAIDEVLVARDPGNDPWRRHLDDLRLRLAAVLAGAGDRAGALAELGRARDFARAALAATADDADWLQRAITIDRRLGGLAVETGDGAAAGTAFAEAIDLARRLPPERPTRLAIAADLIRLAGVRLLDGETAPAVAGFAEAETLLRTVLAEDPRDVVARGELSQLLIAAASPRTRLGRAAAAAAGLREAIDLSTTLAGEAPGDRRWSRQVATAWDRLGDTLAALDDRVGAVAAYRASLAAVAASGPADPAETRAAAMTEEALAPLLEAEGDAAAAFAAASRAVELRRGLASVPTADAADRRALLVDLGLAGRLAAAAGRPAEALPLWRDGLAVARALAAAPAADTDARHDLAIALFLVGSELARGGDAAGAAPLLAEALPIAVDLARAEPANAGCARFAAGVGRALGIARFALADRDGAAAALLAARDADAAVLARDPGHTGDADRLKADVARIGRVAEAMLVARDFERALATVDRATPSAPDQDRLDLVRAAALAFLDRTEEARAVLMRHRGETTVSGRAWDAEALAAFARLRAEGLDHPFLAEAATLLSAPAR